MKINYNLTKQLRPICLLFASLLTGGCGNNVLKINHGDGSIPVPSIIVAGSSNSINVEREARMSQQQTIILEHLQSEEIVQKVTLRIVAKLDSPEKGDRQELKREVRIRQVIAHFFAKLKSGNGSWFLQADQCAGNCSAILNSCLEESLNDELGIKLETENIYRPICKLAMLTTLHDTFRDTSYSWMQKDLKNAMEQIVNDIERLNINFFLKDKLLLTLDQCSEKIQSILRQTMQDAMRKELPQSASVIDGYSSRYLWK